MDYQEKYLKYKQKCLELKEDILKKEIQNISQSRIISAWVSLFEQQKKQLEKARDDAAYFPMNLEGEIELELPVYVLPADYTLIVATIGLSSNDLCELNKEADPRVSAQSTLFWKTRFLNSASIIKKGLKLYAAATDVQLNMGFIIEPNKNSIISSTPKDIMAPTKKYEKAIDFAIKQVKILSNPQDIIEGTHEGNYNEVTLLGPLLFNRLFPNYGPSFTVEGIFVTQQALKQYQKIPTTESHKFLKCLSELGDIHIYIPPS